MNAYYKDNKMGIEIALSALGKEPQMMSEIIKRIQSINHLDKNNNYFISASYETEKTAHASIRINIINYKEEINKEILLSDNEKTWDEKHKTNVIKLLDAIISKFLKKNAILNAKEEYLKTTEELKIMEKE